MNEQAVPGLLDHVLVPISGEEDARRTALALEPYEPGRVTVLFVVEKADGAPDSMSVEQAEGLASDSFGAFRAVVTDIEEEVAYDSNVVETIFESAEEIGASSVVFTTRGGGSIIRLLTGDTARKLVTENDLPVISLPRSDET